MADLGPGLYELLITEGLRAQLDELAQGLGVDDRALDSADASDRIAWHVSRQIERALLDVSEERRALCLQDLVRTCDRSHSVVSEGAISTLNPPPLGRGRYTANV